MNTTVDTSTARQRQLLESACAAALMTVFSGLQQAKADDSDRPLLWIEAGWHYEQVMGSAEPFSPPFVSTIANAGLPSPIGIQKALGYSAGGDGAISFQPDGSDWIFSATIRYGRAGGHKAVHGQIPESIPTVPTAGEAVASTPVATQEFSDAKDVNKESHAIMDFMVGRDVGLGMFRSGSSSIFNFGVRFAQMNSQSAVKLYADPNFTFHMHYFFGRNLPFKYNHHYTGTSRDRRSFHGIGPSLSWQAATPMLGDSKDGEVTLDWGVNGAILFGKQKANVQHSTTGTYLEPIKYQPVISQYQHPTDKTRSRMVAVPNLGGMAGVSLRWSNAKLSLGYRADFFFGAMDGGVDTARKENVGFHGPFATISVGIGG